MRYLTESEWKLASRFLFLSMALLVIQQDLEKIRKFSPFKINEFYLRLLEQMEKLAMDERRHLRKEMNKEKLQVVLDEKNEAFTAYLFICKGKEEKRNYFNPAIRKKVEIIIEELAGRAANILYESKENKQQV